MMFDIILLLLNVSRGRNGIIQLGLLLADGAPHSGEKEDFLTGQPDFFYGNSCNSEMERQKIDPKVPGP